MKFISELLFVLQTRVCVFVCIVVGGLWKMVTRGGGWLDGFA